MQPLKEGVDYYIDNGLYVFTEAYHLKRGYCCGSGCRHCPYTEVKKKIKVAISWSGGKDSALALWQLMQNELYEVDHLFTVFDKELKRVGLHGIPEHLIEKQAEALGLPLKKLYLPASEDHDAYEKLMTNYFNTIKIDGISEIMFGDIFLEDLKLYRDKMLAKAGLKGNYPIWKKDTGNLVRQFVDLGFKTIICAANVQYFSRGQVGAIIDHTFLNSIPETVDPGGENGEYHTFVFDGPLFSFPVDFQRGKIISKTYRFKLINDAGEEEEQLSTYFFRELY